MKKLDDFLKKRNEIARRYYQAFDGIEFIKLPQVNSSMMHAYHLFPVQIQFEKIGLTKLELLKVRAKGINLQVHYIPVHLQPFIKKFGFQLGDFPVAECFYKNEVSLPIYPDLSIQELEKVIEEILSIIK